MPIYSYHCNKCVADKEVILPISKRNDSQVHICGSIMERVISLPQSAIVRRSGKGMALDTLNSKEHYSLPSKYGGKSRTQAIASAGLEEPPKQFF